MELALKRAQDKNETFSLLLFDLDDFKKVNDTYGHECGDLILKMAASTISRGVKASDYVFRWGGEEILVLLKGNKTTAVRAAERIRFDIERQVVEYKGQMIKITSTVGVASYDDKKTARDLFALADENLYIGKNSGKNCVIS
ncbi:MAG: GGDEF domain-containing protein [Treponema sp.]|nr:GGDEF domain-containing protein [Candidatus Treponema equifaecale]